MKLKNIVGFSLIAFVASCSILLVVGLILTHPAAPVNFETDPATGQQVPAGSSGQAEVAASPAASGSPGVSASPAAVYCGGKLPCYGKSALAAHAASGKCWGYNLDWVVNLTGYAPVHPNGPQFVENDLFCGKDVHGALDGSVSIGYNHVHQDVTQSNGSSSILASYRVGYYDGNKP